MGYNYNVKDYSNQLRAKMASYKPKEYVEIDDVLCTRVFESGKAILCVINNEEFVIPISQLGPENEVRVENDEGTLIVAKWFAIKIGVADESK